MALACIHTLCVISFFFNVCTLLCADSLVAMCKTLIRSDDVPLHTGVVGRSSVRQAPLVQSQPTVLHPPAPTPAQGSFLIYVTIH